MSITINAYTMPKNIEDPNYDILSIRYIISKDPTFLDINQQVANVLKPKTDITFKKLSLDYDFEDNVPVYSKVVYSYPNNKTEESTICRCTPDQIGFSFNNNIIVTPEVSILEYNNYNNIPIDGFTINVSKMIMFMGHGEHTATSYSVIDTNNKVVFSSPRDTFNLNSILVPDDVLEENKSYRIEVIQYNNYECESYPAVLCFTTAGSYNLLHIDEDSVILNENSISTFTFYQNLTGFKNLTIDIIDSNTDYVLKDFITSNTKVRLPKMGMIAGNRYYLIVRALYTNHDGDTVYSNSIRISRICTISSIENEYYPEYTYNNILEVSKYNFVDDFIGNGNLLKGVSKQLDNGDIPIYKVLNSNNIEIRFYKYYNSTLVYTGRNFILNTSHTVVADEGVNIFLVEDKAHMKMRLVVIFIVDIAGVKNTELYSYEYLEGQNGNIDITIIPEVMNLPFRSLLTNSVPLNDYTDGKFLLTSIPINSGDKQTIHAVDKNLDSYSNISSLYNSNAVVNNSISTFPLAASKLLVINTDQAPITYGVFNKLTNAYSSRGNVPGNLQNLAEDVNLNKFYGYTRLDGRVLLIPFTNNVNNMHIYLFDNTENTFELLIDNSLLDIPSKYIVDGNLEIGKLFTIELNDGRCLFLMSNNSLVFGEFTDIWEYK